MQSVPEDILWSRELRMAPVNVILIYRGGALPWLHQQPIHTYTHTIRTCICTCTHYTHTHVNTPVKMSRCQPAIPTTHMHVFLLMQLLNAEHAQGPVSHDILHGRRSQGVNEGRKLR